MGIKTEFNWKTKVSSCIDDIYLRITNVYNTLSATTNEIYTRLQQTINEVNTIVATLHTIKPGYMLPYAGSDIPDGYLLCNGAAVSRTTYKDLFNRIGTTYGAGDGSTTFNLPDVTNRFIQGNGTPGTYVDAGLPNITGHFPDGSDNDGYGPGGAFYKESWTHSAAYDGTVHPRVIGMNAARSSGIYGRSSSVQPPALRMYYIIKY